MGNNTQHQSRSGNPQTLNPPPPAQPPANTLPFIQTLPAARDIVWATQHPQSTFPASQFQPTPIAPQRAPNSPTIGAASTYPSSVEALQSQITSWFVAQDLFTFDIGVTQFVSLIQIGTQELYSWSDVGIQSYLNAVNNRREGYHPFFTQLVIDALVTHICQGRRVCNEAHTDSQHKVHNELQLRIPLPNHAVLFQGFFPAGTCEGVIDLKGWITNWLEENSISTLGTERATFLSCITISDRTLLGFSEKEIQEYFEIINDLTGEPFLEQRLIDALVVEVCWTRWMHKLQQEEVLMDNLKTWSFGEDENGPDNGESTALSRGLKRDSAPEGEWQVVKGQRRGKSETMGRSGRISRSGRKKAKVLYPFSKAMKYGGSENGKYYHSIGSGEE